MRKPFAPPSSLARSLIPILKPCRAIMSLSNVVEMKDCLICTESKLSPRKFPDFPSCDHDANTCIDCYVQQAIVLIEQHHRWNAVTCPACNVALPAGDLAVVLPRHEFTRLDDSVKKAALIQNPNWRWCLAPGCGHGQIHGAPEKSQVIKCIKCDAKSCFKHQIKWHSNYTCDAYDMSHPESAVTKTDEDTIKRITKACPNCERRIQKEGGCSHMVCPSCHRTFFWNRLAFDGEEQASSAEYVGGPTVRFLGLDEDVENAIMVMEGTETFTNVAPRPAPQILTPTPTILHRRPVLGGLRLPATPAPPRVTHLPRSTPLDRANATRRGAVDSSSAGVSRVHRDIVGARPVGLRRSPRLRNFAGDLDDELRRLEEDLGRVSRGSTGMEERGGRRAPQTWSGDDPLTDENELPDDLIAEYEQRHEQQRAEREAAPLWPHRFHSMEDSVLSTRPLAFSALPLGSEDESERNITGQSQVTRQARLPSTGFQYSPSLRGGHQMLGGAAIVPRTRERVPGSQEEPSHRLEIQASERGYHAWAGTPPVNDRPLFEAHYYHRRMMEVEGSGDTTASKRNNHRNRSVCRKYIGRDAQNPPNQCHPTRIASRWPGAGG